MEKKYGLDDLKDKSKPALKHGALVQLAREHSPTMAVKRAQSAHWPRREVNAMRFLAILRRDYGDEVFEDFITTMEHAHANRPAMEQAREVKKMNKKLLETLSKIPNLQERLELMLEQKLYEEAGELIEELANSQMMYFWQQDSYTRFVPLAKRDFRGSEVAEYFYADHLKNLRLISHEGSEYLSHSTAGEVGNGFEADFIGLMLALGWEKERVDHFVMVVLSKMIDQDYRNPGGGRPYLMSRGAQEVCSQIKMDEELERKVNLWILKFQLHDGNNLTTLIHDCLSEKEQKKYNYEYDFKPVVDQMVALGMKMEEIREEIIDWLDHEAHHDSDLEIVASLADVRCFHAEDGERASILRKYYADKLWEMLLTHGNKEQWKVFDKFLDLWVWYVGSEYDQKFFQNELATQLSKGRARWVHEFLEAHASSVFDTMMNKSKNMARLALSAFNLAFENGRYGIAAAIAQHYEEVPREKAKEALESAGTCNLPIRLDFAEKLVKDR